MGRDFQQEVGKDEADRDERGLSLDHETFIDHLSVSLSTVPNANRNVVGDGLWRLTDQITGTGIRSTWCRIAGSMSLPATALSCHKVRWSAADGRQRTIDCHLDVGKVNSYYKLASSIEWRRAVYEELYGIVDTWVWEHNLMAEMATLLLYATHIQTFWDWRPNVSLDGQTDSGKTEWVEFMKDVYFGWLCTYSRYVGGSHPAVDW